MTVVYGGTGNLFTANQRIHVIVSGFFAAGTVGNQYPMWCKNVTDFTVAGTAQGADKEVGFVYQTGQWNTHPGVWTGILEKGETLTYIGNGEADNGGFSGESFIAMTVTPDVNDVIILESQDEIFTDWVEYTPTTQGLGSPLNVKVLWRRVGGNMEIQGYMTLGTVSSTDSSMMSLPSGYSVNNNGAGDQKTIFGYYTRLTGANAWLTADARQGVFTLDVDTNLTSLLLSSQTSSVTEIRVAAADQFFGSGNSITFNLSVPIQGWNANFNPLLSMPLVDVGSNIESGRWGTAAGYATANKIQQYSTEFVNTFSGLGTVVSDSTVGWTFTALQRIKVIASSTMYYAAAGNVGGWSLNASAGTTGITSLAAAEILCLVTSASNNYGIDAQAMLVMEPGDVLRPHTNGDAINSAAAWRVQITAERDYSNTNMAHIIKPAVALIKDVKGYNTDGDTISLGNWRTLVLNTFQGETWFVTPGTGTLGVDGINTNFTLEKGTYKIMASAPFYQCGNVAPRLFNVTKNDVEIYGTSVYCPGTAGHTPNGFVDVVLTLTASTEFKIEAYPSASGMVGVKEYNYSAAVSVYTTVRIEKLK
jgi:hypothetical protein